MNKVQEELVLRNDSVVSHLVRKIRTGNFKKYDYDDLMQIGRIGLIKAAETYNGSTKFITYASRCVSNEILMFLRKESRKKDWTSLDLGVAVDFDGNELTLGETIESPNSDFEKSVGDLNEIERIFNIALNTFDSKELIIWLYSMIGKRQDDLANLLGISQSYISRLRKRFYAKLNVAVHQNNNINETYHIDISSNECKISFIVENFNEIDYLIFSLLNNSEIITDINISRVANRVYVIFSNFEEALPVIAFLLYTIDKNAIKLVTEKSNATQTSEVRNYIKKLKYFTTRDIQKHFPDISSPIISSAIAYSKNIGEISHIRRGVYTSNLVEKVKVVD